jgi:SAM-dependent methyltransferase
MSKINSTIFLKIVEDSGFNISHQWKILDFGCGNGDTVKELLDMGYDAMGCDVKFKSGTHVDFLKEHDRIQTISLENYCLPYPDDSFDLVISNQVLEHVYNFSETLAEIHRILKPHGICCHIFPAKFKIRESHVYVPFSSVIKNYYYLLFWAFLGIKKPNQQGKSPQEIAKENHNYLISSTNYLSVSQVFNFFNSEFKNVYFCEKFYLKNSPSNRGRQLYKIGLKIPFIFSLYRIFMSYVVIAGDEISSDKMTKN